MANVDLAIQYQIKTDKQHILDNPGTYIGAAESVDALMWVYDQATGRIVLRNIDYVPGLYKLYDEGFVNCRDHIVRMIQCQATDKKNVAGIEITVADDGTITMENDGNGIDVAKHPEHDLWIPEMIFAHLRTSTNYNKNEKRIVGGQNGFGSKLIFIWSVYGKIETVDHTRGLKYVQEFKRNLDEICAPTITKVKSQKPYTRITFKPDYARFGMPAGLTDDMKALFRKRASDIAAVSDHSVKKVQFKYNGGAIPIKNFTQYVDCYVGAKTEEGGARAYEAFDERWEYAVALSPTHEFVAISFVNGICTFKGGKHVDYVMSQITRKLCAHIEKKKKMVVNPNTIKEQLMLFLRCDIENPAFDSQSKDFLNTPSAKFGSSCVVSDAFIAQIAKMGVMEVACSLTEAKENKSVAKKTDGSKTKTVRGIANYIDANHSGTAKSGDCILILCEGLSALSGIVSGLSSGDRNTIGIYPLKGKLLNVRGETTKKIADNKEITDLKKILGLENARDYKTMADVKTHLRYGKILILCDQDTDGSHIKGLCINLFHSEWSSLVRIPGFLAFMNTPILRAKKGNQTRLFYNEGEYLEWKRGQPTVSPRTPLPSSGTYGTAEAGGSCAEGADERAAFKQGVAGGRQPPAWTIKYFKGLGTSTSTEFKEYFANKKIVDFVYNGADSDDAIDKVFNKKRANDRKVWLEAYDKEAFLDTTRASVRYEEFLNNEMIHFSTYDCARSIPNMVDGLKISLRKILFAAFKRRLTAEIKVAQFSGYVSEHSAYHHGEASLNGAIVGMAQTFVGSNNINLLEPNGQFGTRLHGGDDSASERYIFTQLSPVARKLFPEADDAVLTYLNDDGTMVEPEFYVPIIPFALVNGISGIGTGFSSNIPSYNPIQIIAYLRAKLSGAVYSADFVPYYKGFKGTVVKGEGDRFVVRGVFVKTGEDKLRITELPVGTWTMPYIAFLEELVVNKLIKDFVSISTEVVVDITVSLLPGKLATTTDDEIVKMLKLSATVSNTNMHMFNQDCRLCRYTSVPEIIDAFYDVRMRLYEKRKAFLETELRKQLRKLSNRARYINETLADTIDLRRKTAAQVGELLIAGKYDTYDEDFKYLTKMPMDSVSVENVAVINRERDACAKELEDLVATSLSQMWLNELAVLEKELLRTK